MIIEIALGVFLGGILLWMLYSYKERQKQKLAKKLEQDNLLKEFTEHFLICKLQFNGYIDVFKTRLETLEDDADLHFHDAGQIELKIFNERLAELKEQIRDEMESVIKYKNSDAATELIMRKLLEDFLTEYTREIGDTAMIMMLEKTLEINSVHTERNNKVIDGNDD